MGGFREGQRFELAPTFERLGEKIGDRIGRKLARALVGLPSEPSPSSRRVKRVCSREGCERFAVAKALCKNHYNLMLYHRRKASAGGGAKRSGKRG